MRCEKYRLYSKAQLLTLSRGIVRYHLQRSMTNYQAAKQFIPHRKALSKHLSFDEFKYAKGEMAFEYINAESGDILDILDRRNNFTVKNHFMVNYSLTDHQHVKIVTIVRKKYRRLKRPSEMGNNGINGGLYEKGLS